VVDLQFGRASTVKVFHNVVRDYPLLSTVVECVLLLLLSMRVRIRCSQKTLVCSLLLLYFFRIHQLVSE